jgi:hypothetical protein
LRDLGEIEHHKSYNTAMSAKTQENRIAITGPKSKRDKIKRKAAVPPHKYALFLSIIY